MTLPDRGAVERLAELLRTSLARGVACSEGHGDGAGVGRLDCPFCVDALWRKAKAKQRKARPHRTEG